MPSPHYVGVRVGKLPGRIGEVALNGDRTVRTALEGAELDSEGYEIRVNSEKVGLDHVLTEGDTVLLVRPVKGNN